MRHFTKVSVGSTFFDGVGRPIAFKRISQQVFAISTDDPEVLKTLDGFIKQNIGGVAEVSERELEELKKKALNSPPSANEWFGGPQAAVDTASSPSPNQSPADLAAVVGSSMKPIVDEVAELRAQVAELAAKKKAPEVEKNVPPPTPPSVGKRTPAVTVSP